MAPRRAVRWEAQAADGTWESGMEQVPVASSEDAYSIVCEMLWAGGYAHMTVEVIG